MIEVSHLSKRFGDRLALDDVSFSVGAGRVTAFLGPNGSGKTTTMRILLGLDFASAGVALVNGVPFATLRDPMSQLGALLDARGAHPGRSAFNHLRALALTHHVPNGRVDDVLDQVGLQDVAGNRVGGFSLGMRQRLGIAGALLGDPSTLIFDEPINGLDPDGVHWFRQLVRDLANQGKTVFLSSHLISEVALTADHVIVLGRGRVLADAPLAEFGGAARVHVRTRRASELARLLDSAGIVNTVSDDTVSAESTSTGTVGELAASAGIALSELFEDRESLEGVYRALTGSDVEYRPSVNK
ncbi:ATP-binding cassette domain-containing protein [Agreia sp. COWG]|uniref:ATP-binding cassette domain-containing protein n=1 Tax=Agreia sp. COWG TaxID=2773266 RepID=UPI0019288DAF|nr:ATP-binding cassette domain-containing protein [Agreia sp. COWG]CAD6010423.1 ABC-2 type transport system ATP-binding protein [Agreia sp. COWG]